ncbi:MAG: chromosome partitioning protein ParB, partial [Flavobacteriaceae bacterium]|nr:chromosome partitioning protein ParB [Flavobacteriaceae bacterium]
NGEDYEFNPGVRPEEMVYQHKYPEIPASAQFMIQSQQMEAEAMIGNKAFSGGLTGQALGNTATGVRGALDASARRDLDILNRLANGLIEVARKVVAMNKLFLSDKEVVRITNEEFVLINRNDLDGHFDLRMTISTAEVDNQKAQELGFMLQTIGPNTSFDFTKLLLTEIATLRKMPTLAKRLDEYAPQPDPLAQRRAELELMLLEAQIQETMANAQSKGSTAELNSQKSVTELAKQNNLQSQTDKNNLDYVEQETGTKQERELQKQGAQARANMQLELVKNALNPSKSQAKTE